MRDKPLDSVNIRGIRGLAHGVSFRNCPVVDTEHIVLAVCSLVSRPALATASGLGKTLGPAHDYSAGASCALPPSP